MSFVVNGTKIENFVCNGVSLTKFVCNGTTVWQSPAKLVQSSSVLKSGTVIKSFPTEQLTTNVSVNLNGNVISFGKDNTVCAGVFWLVDMTARDTIVVNADFNIGNHAWAYPVVRSGDSNCSLVKSYTEVGSDNGATTKTINTTFKCSGLTGNHYVGFYFWGGGGQQGGTITVKDLIVK